MTSPYSSSLLNEPAAESIPRPMAPRPAVPAPAYAQVPQYAAPAPVVYAQPQKSSNAAMGLMVLLLVVLAAGAGYLVSRSGAPSAEEALRYQSLAASDGFFNGRQAGVEVGRQTARANGAEVARLKALIARQKAYNAGYRKGRHNGMASYRRPTSTGRSYYSGYRAPVYRNPNRGTVNGAIAQAQNWANITGAPVDVEVY